MFRRAYSVLLLFLLSSCSSRIAAQRSALEAELPKALATDPLTPGSSFVLKVTSAWQDGECTFPPGTVIHAVVQRSEHNVKGKVTSISFGIQVACADAKPLDVVVTSLLAPAEVEQLDQQFFRGSSFGGSSSSASSGLKQGDTPDMSGRQNAALPFSVRPLDKAGRPASVHLGEVYHLSRIKLSVPPPGGTESTISTTGTTLNLPARTTFVLQASRMEHQPPALVTTKFSPSGGPTQHVRHALISACVRGHCTRTSSGVSAGVGFGTHILGSGYELSSYGFRGEGDHELKDLNNGTTVHFLDDEEVVVTFPSHQLVRRSAGIPQSAQPRSIRAVLLQASTSSVKTVQNWQIQDSNAYIWDLGNRILVHENGALKVLGPGLQEMTSFPLEGPLAAVRVSPDGTHVLVGQIHELHSAEEHGLLVQADARGAEEEVRWHVLDDKLGQPRLFGTSSSYRFPPVLLNEGLIELRKEANDRYHLINRNWTAEAETQLGSFTSTCMPSIESTRPNLLLLYACDGRDLGAHSFLFHPDGAPVLDEAFTWHDLPMSSLSASNTQRLAFMVTRGKEEYTRGQAFRLSSLKDESAEVVDVSNGALVASIPLPVMSPYKQIVALSPNGHKLAMLHGSKLLVYEIEH